MFQNPQIHHKSTPRPNFAIIPNSFDIKNMPNLTAPSESAENLQFKFAYYNKYTTFSKFGQQQCFHGGNSPSLLQIACR